MILDGIVVALCSFGAAAFCFAAGFVVGGSRDSGASVFPATHVSFSADLTQAARLEFLEAAKEAVTRGQLGKPDQLGDHAPSHEGK